MEPRPARRELDWRAAAVPALLLLALFSPVLLRGRTALGFDFECFSIPQLTQLEQAYARLEVPGWNPLRGLGQPFAADLGVAAYYPPHAVLLLLSPVAALNLLLVAHIALGYVGAWRLALDRRASRLAAHLVALVHAFGGISIGYVNIPGHAFGNALLPWCVLAATRALAPGAPALQVGGAAVPFALAFLAGSPESCALAAGLALALALADGAGPGRATGRLLVTGALAIALCAVAIAPFVHALGETERGKGLPYDEAAKWSLRPAELLGAAVPGHRPLRSLEPPDQLRPWHATASIGLVTLALGAAGAAWARRRREARVLLVVLALSLLFALGRHGPLYPALWELVPPVRAVRYPAKALALTTLVLSLLAGVGLDGLRGPRGAGGAARAAALAVALAAGVLATSVAVFALAGGERRLALALLVPVGAALAIVLALRSSASERARRALVVTLAVELGISAWLSVDLGPRELYTPPPPRLARALLAEQDARGAPVRVTTAASVRERSTAEVEDGGRLGPLAAVEREGLVANSNACWGLRSAEDFSTYTAARVQALRTALAARDTHAAPRLRSLGVSHAIIDFAPGPDVELVDVAGVLGLVRLRDAPPWAATYTRAHSAPDLPTAIDRALDPGFSTSRECVIEGATTSRGDVALVETARAARVVSIRADRLELEVDGPAGWLVVREAYASGWTATVDGTPAPIHPADAVFRAVPVPAGRHLVVLAYAAPWRAAGAWTSLVAWSAVLGLLALRRVRAEHAHS